MMKIFYGILFLLSVISVSCKRNNDEPKFSDLMITYNQQILNQQDSSKKRIPPLPINYSDNNLIIDSSGNIYFYHWHLSFFCGTGNNIQPPYFIGLEPNDVYRVPVNSFDEFMKANLIYYNNYEVIAIAVPADSFRNPVVPMIRKFFLYKNSKHGDSSVSYAIRKITEEESVVLQYKKSGEMFYFPREIKWDTTKIRLPDNFYRKNYQENIR